MLETRLVKILSNSLGVTDSEINSDTSMESLDAWDSLAHLSVVITIEEEFEISLNEEEILRMTSFSEIFELLKSKNLEN